MSLDAHTAQMTWMTAADETSVHIILLFSNLALWILTFVLHMILETSISLPNSVLHGNENSFESHLLLPGLFVIHLIARDAHRCIAGISRIFQHTSLVNETNCIIVLDQTAG